MLTGLAELWKFANFPPVDPTFMSAAVSTTFLFVHS